MSKPKYSVLIPVYKSDTILNKTIFETTKELQSQNLNYEIILINDGSPDNSWNVISEIQKVFPNIKAINLLKNYGQHTAVFCGLKYASGDFLITMDDDLQNPPEEIIKLINKIEEGYDLVFAKFLGKKHASYRKIGSRIVGYINRKIFNYPKDITLTNFRIFTREVADRVVNYKTNYPYIPGLLLMFSSKIGNVYTEHAKREVGQSNYTIRKIIRLVSRLLINYSSLPLVLLSYIGIGTAVVGFLVAIWVIVKAFLFGTSVEGWASLMVLTSFFSGLLVLMIGIIGVYVSRILKQISNPQSYEVKEVLNNTPKNTAYYE